MNVQELKMILEHMPDDAVVYSEGCDCTDTAVGVDHCYDQVTIARNDPEFKVKDGVVVKRAPARMVTYDPYPSMKPKRLPGDEGFPP